MKKLKCILLCLCTVLFFSVATACMPDGGGGGGGDGGGNPPCSHESYTDGICGECGTVCSHDSYTDGVCDTCETVCTHQFQDGTCGICGLQFTLQYTLATDGDSYVVTGANDKTAVVLEIPATHENKPVKKIAAEAFKGYTNLVSVTLPEGLEEIGSKAFF